MNWKQEATDKLRRYALMRTSRENLGQELQRVSLDRGDALSRQVLREELKNALQQAELWVGQVERAMGVLLPEERLILNRCYISGERGAVDRLCGELKAEPSTVYRKRDKALEAFTLALYGRVDS